MADKVLNDPLTGEEIILALSDHIANSLRRDCFLNAHTAYSYYSANISIGLVLHDASGMRTAEVEQTIIKMEGEVSNDQIDELEEIEGELVIEPKPPNEERVMTGQPIPVLSKDSDGRVVTKHIKYARNKAGSDKPAAKSARKAVAK